jgi:hypothetical protein
MTFVEFETILTNFKQFLTSIKSPLAYGILEKNSSSDKQNLPITRSEIAFRLANLMEKEVDFEGNFKK